MQYCSSLWAAKMLRLGTPRAIQICQRSSQVLLLWLKITKRVHQGTPLVIPWILSWVQLNKTTYLQLLYHLIRCKLVWNDFVLLWLLIAYFVGSTVQKPRAFLQRRDSEIAKQKQKMGFRMPNEWRSDAKRGFRFWRASDFWPKLL